MEKKTIGGFISALRRSKGLTQRELAEMLNVSDKAVSRWERDECAPDLLLIPVIADIFGVTSDEILRGERRISEEKITEPEVYSERSEKALKAILARQKSAFLSKIMVCYALVALGVVLAMCFNFALNKAAIGFFAGCAWIIGAVFVVAIAYKNHMLSLETDDFPEGLVFDFRRYVINNMRNAVTVIAAAFMLILPYLIVAITYDAYVGLTFYPWLLSGFAGVLISFAVCKLIFNFKTVSDIEKGKYSVSEAELSAYKTRNIKITKFLKNEALATIAIIVELAVLWTVMQGFDFFAKRTFYTFEEAQAYIYEANQNFYGDPSIDVDFKLESIEDDTTDGNKSAYNVDVSNDVSIWEVSFTNEHIFFEKNGVVLEELLNPQNVVYRVEIFEDEDGLNISLWTHYARQQGQRVAYIITAVIVLVYLALSFGLYSNEFFKRKTGG